ATYACGGKKGKKEGNRESGEHICKKISRTRPQRLD
ncbi:unnamed protein product, partial [marine sediment metagenome]